MLPVSALTQHTHRTFMMASFNSFLLSLAVLLAACASAQAAGVARTPADVVELWNERETASKVDPCLAMAICNWFPSSDAPSGQADPAWWNNCARTIYQPGYDLMWFSGWRSIQQILQWNAELTDPTERGQLSWYITNDAGFEGGNSTALNIFVWNQCNVEKGLGEQSQYAQAVALADYAQRKYGVVIPSAVLRVVVYGWWGVTSDIIWGPTCDLGCAANTAFANGEDCGCDDGIVEAWRSFAPYDPSSSSYAPEGGHAQAASAGDEEEDSAVSAAAAEASSNKYGSKHGASYKKYGASKKHGSSSYDKHSAPEDKYTYPKQDKHSAKHGKHSSKYGHGGDDDDEVVGPTAAACLRHLRDICADPGDCTPAVVRAGLGVCFAASALNTGLGMGWTPIIDEMERARFFNGLTNPEYLFPNTPNSILREFGLLRDIRLTYP